MSALPDIGDIVWYNSGYGTQTVKFYGMGHPGLATTVKVFVKVGEGRQYLDRFQSMEAAKRFISRMRRGSLI
jgi:hypothetical protein